MRYLVGMPNLPLVRQSVKQLVIHYGWRIVLAISALSGLCVWIWQAQIPALPGHAQQGAVWVIREAVATVTPDGLPSWQTPVRLPFKWDTHHPGRGGVARFEIQLPAVDPGVPYALHLARVGNQAVVKDIHGAVLAQWGDLRDPAMDSTRLPRLVHLSRAALESGKLVIETSTQSARSGGLGPVHFGPTPDIVSAHEWRYKWRVDGSLVIVANLILLTVFSLGIWWFRKDPLAIDLGLGGALGAFVYWARTVEVPPLAWPWWGACVAVAILMHVLFFWRVWVMVFDVSSVWARPRIFFGAMLAGTSATSVAFVWGMPALWTAVLFATLLFSVSTFMLLLRKLHREKKPTNTLQVALHILILLLLQWDVVAGRILGDGVGTVQMAPVATLLTMGLFAFLLMHRFNHHPPHVHAAAFALDRGRQMERERIMRDLHDGVAGNLFGLKQMLGRANVSRPQILQEMESVMDEMRMTIDSLQPSNNDLGTILATLRYRLQPRLEAAGIRIIWRLPELHSEIIIAPEKIFHVQKILMEALTNVQKHSGASNVWVQMEVPSSAVQTGQAVISIEDDGGGMDPAVDTSHGVGLESMKARAEAVGAELSVGHGPRGGTLVTLRVRWQPDA